MTDYGASLHIIISLEQNRSARVRFPPPAILLFYVFITCPFKMKVKNPKIALTGFEPVTFRLRPAHSGRSPLGPRVKTTYN